MPQPQNQGAWRSATQGLLGSAKGVTDELFAALKDKDINPPKVHEGIPQYVPPGPKHKSDLDHNLGLTRFAMFQVDNAMQKSQQIIIHVGHEQQKKWAPLKVCEWRLALRGRRPARELFKDSVSQALEDEEKALLESRVKLVEIQKEGKAILEDCEANKARLVRIVRCMVCYGQSKVSATDIIGKDGDPASPSSPSTAPPEEGAPPPAEGEEAPPPSPTKKRPNVPSDAAGLLRRAPVLLESVLQYVKKCDDACKFQKAKCVAANLTVLAAFKKRWGENAVLKKSLEAQIAQMNEAIVTAEKALVGMKKRIEFFKEVEFQPKYDNAQVILNKLKESKEFLEDDFHHKIVAMKIDESCRKITPERASGEDPMTRPVAAMLEGPSHRKKKMNNSASSPSMDNTMRPGSPAGVSSPLKAAAAASLA